MADFSGVPRLRERREALTLRSILTAARDLFADRGYARTTIRDIAAAAGVAPQTIYAHFGSKAGVMAGLVDLVDEEAGLDELLAEADNTKSSEALIGLLAKANRQIHERCGDIIAMFRSGAAVEPAIAATQQEGERRNRAGVELLIARIEEAGRSTVPRAVDVVYALTSTDIYHRLVGAGGWTPAEYESWLVATVIDAILPETGEDE